MNWICRAAKKLCFTIRRLFNDSHACFCSFHIFLARLLAASRQRAQTSSTLVAIYCCELSICFSCFVYGEMKIMKHKNGVFETSIRANLHKRYLVSVCRLCEVIREKVTKADWVVRKYYMWYFLCHIASPTDKSSWFTTFFPPHSVLVSHCAIHYLGRVSLSEKKKVDSRYIAVASPHVSCFGQAKVSQLFVLLFTLPFNFCSCAHGWFWNEK